MSKKKITIPIRDGQPDACICCGKELHPKSEYYCSIHCHDSYPDVEGKDKPAFLSKWKVRKRKEAKDPLIRLRHKIRAKTRALVKQGRLKKRPCVVCQSQEVLAHHEDYSDPFNVIWICKQHHTDYHDGKITLFNGKLRWDPQKLIPRNAPETFPKKKYLPITSNRS